MTRAEVQQLHSELCARGLEILKKKNSDYCKNGPFDNFRVCEALQICSPEHGILIRMSDKLSRLSSIFEKGAKVLDESEEDTIVDLINYAVLMAAMRREKKLSSITTRAGGSSISFSGANINHLDDVA